MQVLFKIADELNDEKVDVSSIENLELLIGQIIINRISGIAYDKIDLSTLHYEAIKLLRFYKENNVFNYDRFVKNLEFLSLMLKSIDFEYALLKGAFLIPFLYPKGHRTSNDIDILLDSGNVSKLQNLLLQNGFIQGHLSSLSEIIPATRKEIIESKMNYGETVPFLKLIDGIVLEIDLNLSMDYKPSRDNMVLEMLSKTIDVKKGDIHFKTLNHKDFLIHLCCHLYKEATTYDWVKCRDDLMLYKFSDINVFLHKYGNEEYFIELTKRIKQFGIEKECYYAFENSSIIYPNLNRINGFAKTKERIRPHDLQFMNQVIYPYEKKLFQHHMSFAEWFFCTNRVIQLEEVPYETN